MMKTLAITAASVGLLFSSAPAFAADGETPTMEISTAGLDLNSPEGQEILDQRIDRAAREVCGANDEKSGTRIRSFEVRECVANAKASAKSQLAVVMEDVQRGG